MFKVLKLTALIVVLLLVQVTLLPAYLRDPFKPNLLLALVVYLGLRVPSRLGWALAFFIGILQDCFSGIYLGLHGFVYLTIHFLFQLTSDRLYTGSRYLMVLAVFLATLGGGLLELVLLVLFSVAQGVYATLLPSLVPQALVNAFFTSVVLGVFPSLLKGEQP